MLRPRRPLKYFLHVGHIILLALAEDIFEVPDEELMKLNDGMAFARLVDGLLVLRVDCRVDG